MRPASDSKLPLQATPLRAHPLQHIPDPRANQRDDQRNRFYHLFQHRSNYQMDHH